jgi:hypothetical protein
VCAHVGVGVDDTLAAALHVAGYERGIGAMAGEGGMRTVSVQCRRRGEIDS